MNPLFNAVATSNTNDISGLYKMFMSSPNPMILFTQLVQNNPSMQPIVQMLNNGTPPEQIVRNECTKRGIDFNQFMNQFR